MPEKCSLQLSRRWEDHHAGKVCSSIQRELEEPPHQGSVLFNSAGDGRTTMLEKCALQFSGRSKLLKAHHVGEVLFSSAGDGYRRIS
jgi:hypothetical protein